MKYTEQDIIAAIAKSENDRSEYKSKIELNDLCDYIVGIGNEGGGTLYIGISNKKPRQAVGTNSLPEIKQARRSIYDKLKIRVEIHERTVEGKRVLVIEIPSRPYGVPLAHSGRYLMRVDDSLVPMTADQLNRIFDESRSDILMEAATDHISGDMVIALLDVQVFFDLLKQPFPKNQQGILEKLMEERLIKAVSSEYVITKLGAYLIAKDLTKFESLRSKGVRVVIYKGTKKLETLRDSQGKKGYASGFEGLIEYIKSQLPSNEHIEEALRTTVKIYPDIAIRELVSNAIIHQDFSITGARVTVEIYTDRIAITNPGRPIIDEKRFIDGYRSRNETLADIMRRIGICEEQGSGVDKVIDSVEVYQLPAPNFTVSETHTSAILYAPIPFADMSRTDKIRATYQHCCLRYVCNEKMSNQSLRERFNIPERADTTSQIIQQTIKEDLIKIDDPTNNSKRYARYVPFWA